MIQSDSVDQAGVEREPFRDRRSPPPVEYVLPPPAWRCLLINTVPRWDTDQAVLKSEVNWAKVN
jgi:hypothetical protein